MEELSDAEFLLFLKKILKIKNYEQFLQLSKDKAFIDRVNNAVRNDIYKGQNKMAFNRFIKVMNDFFIFKKMEIIFNNPSSLTLDERCTNISREFNYYDSSHSIFDYLFVEKVNVYKRFYRMVVANKKNLLDIESYNAIKPVVKEILNKYKENSDLEEISYYIFTELKIESSMIINISNYIMDDFFTSLFIDDRVHVFDEFSYEEIMIFKSIATHYHMAFFSKYEKRFYEEESCQITEEENNKIVELYELIKKLVEKYNDNYYEIIYELAVNYGITFSNMNTIYKDLNYKYSLVDYDINPKVYNDIVENFKNVYLFHRILYYYSVIINKSATLYEEMISNKKNSNRNIEIVYYVLVCNNVTPSNLEKKFSKVSCYAEKQQSNSDLKLFIDGYYKFYAENKEFVENQKEVSKIKKKEATLEYQMQYVDYYTSIIQDLIDSKTKNPKEYFTSIGYNTREMNNILNVVKELNPQMYEKYLEYLKSLESETQQNDEILLNKLKEIIYNMKTYKKYTMLDYYDDTDIDIDLFKDKFLSMLSDIDRAMFYDFWWKFKVEKELSLSEIDDFLRNLDITYVVEKDELNNVLSTYKVTEQDKRDAVEQLITRKIPIKASTIMLIIKRHYEEDILPKLLNNKTKRI